VAKLLAAKERLGLDRKRSVDVESIGDVIDDPAVNEKAQEIADRAVTLVRNGGNMLPLAAPDRTCFVTMTEGRYSNDGVTFAQEVRKRVAQGRADRAGRHHDARPGGRFAAEDCRPARNTRWRPSRR
jgi:beta-glucosidase-like glycosyl hydrolase